MAEEWDRFFERFPEAAAELNKIPGYWPDYWRREALRANCYKNKFDMEFVAIRPAFSTWAARKKNPAVTTMKTDIW